MFSYGTLTPATFQTIGSTPPGPSYNYIWAATSKSDPFKSILVSTDGLNWTKKTGSSSSNEAYFYLEFINETKEVIKLAGNSSASVRYNVIRYNVDTNSVTTSSSGQYPFGNLNNPTSFSDRVTFNNGRNMWLAVTSVNHATYGGVTSYNTAKYLTGTGSKSSANKLRYQIADYYITNSDSEPVIVYAGYGDTGYLYYQASGSFTGSFTNVWSQYNTALTNAGITSYKGVMHCHYMPNVGFVFITKYGPVVFNITNNTWSAQRIWSLGSGAGINLEMITYEPERGRLYLIGDDDSGSSSGFIKIYYTDDGVNWNTLGNLVSGNINPNGKKSIAADYDKVIVCSNSGRYAIYTYATGTWTFNTGITFPSNDGFYDDGFIYCFPYTSD